MKKLLVILICCLTLCGCASSELQNDVLKKDDEIKEVVVDNEEVESTKDKTALFLGDSIVYGFKSNHFSWAEYIKENYDLSSCTNAGISDYRVSIYDDKNKWLVSEMEPYKNSKYDYVIMEGGINDIFYFTPLGEISSSFDKESFDINTFAGGLERYLYEAKNNWPDAKIGYIVFYYTPKYVERGKSWNYDDYKKYVDLLIKILDKWDIKYINLFDDKYSDMLKVETNTYLPDYLHLNKEGYEIISPYIYDFMKNL